MPYPYLATNPYLTVEELCEELKTALPDEDTDEGKLDAVKFNRAIERGSRLVDEHCQRDFFQHDFTTVPIILDQFSRGVYGDKIMLPYDPIISLTQLDAGSETFVEDTDFTVNQAEGIIYSLRGKWVPSRPDGLIKIYGMFGYAQADPTAVPVGLPGKVIIAARLAAAFLSGDARKEYFPIDGEGPITVAMSELPKTFFHVLGARMPILT